MFDIKNMWAHLFPDDIYYYNIFCAQENIHLFFNHLIEFESHNIIPLPIKTKPTQNMNVQDTMHSQTNNPTIPLYLQYTFWPKISKLSVI